MKGVRISVLDKSYVQLEDLMGGDQAVIRGARICYQSVGAEVIASACQQCERTLAMAARRAKARIKVIDIAQLVWEAMKEGWRP